ncbi:hypothetical protein CO704_09115 [Cedecea neteri]|uniref:Uncharacterized protein n=1 Tax=Cedecea neteri TaxID=158822 RepID=A0A291E5H6_9ENTR|nr:hypothetical protein CO704_09115 [Cedecea neteri]
MHANHPQLYDGACLWSRLLRTLRRTCHVNLRNGYNEYVDMYISAYGRNRLLPNDGRNLNIFF